MSKVMGQRIHDKREEYHMTVEELADKLGVTRQSVYRWESGTVKNIDRDYIAKMSAMFHCEPEGLMHMEDSPLVTATYRAPGKEPVTVTVNKEPIMGAASLRARLYKAAMNVRPQDLNIAIELLQSLSPDDDHDAPDEKLA